MALKDRNIAWLRQKHTIPYQRFGLDIGPTSVGALVGIGTGAPVANEISDFGLGGISMEVGDMVAAWDFDFLSKVDIEQEIGVRVVWTGDINIPAASDACTWVVLYDQVDPGEAIIEPATPLSTTIAAQTEGSVVGFKLHKTSRGIIAKGTFDETARQGLIAFRVESDAVTSYAAGEITFLGLELDYIPRQTVQGGEDVRVFADLPAVNTL